MYKTGIKPSSPSSILEPPKLINPFYSNPLKPKSTEAPKSTTAKPKPSDAPKQAATSTAKTSAADNEILDEIDEDDEEYQYDEDDADDEKIDFDAVDKLLAQKNKNKKQPQQKETATGAATSKKTDSKNAVSWGDRGGVCLNLLGLGSLVLSNTIRLVFFGSALLTCSELFD